MKKEKPNPNFHMTLSDRIVIEQGLREGKTFQDIAAEVNKDPTTISKEVKQVVKACDFKNDPVQCFLCAEMVALALAPFLVTLGECFLADAADAVTMPEGHDKVTNWDTVIARDAPSTPMFKPQSNIKTGSRTMFSAAPVMTAMEEIRTEDSALAAQFML